MGTSNYIKIYIIAALLVVILSAFLLCFLMQPSEQAYAEERSSSYTLSMTTAYTTGKQNSSWFYANKDGNGAYDGSDSGEGVSNRYYPYGKVSGSLIKKYGSLSLTVSFSGYAGMVSTYKNGGYIYSTSYTTGKTNGNMTVLFFGSNSQDDYTNTYNRINNDTAGTVDSGWLNGSLIGNVYIDRDSPTETISVSSNSYKYYWYIVSYQWCGSTAHSNNYLTIGISYCHSDTTAPNILCDSNNSNTTYYKRTSFTISSSSNDIAYLLYKKPGDSNYTWEERNSLTVSLYSGSSANNGTWYFKFVDVGHNYSSEYTVIADTIAPSGSLSGVSSGGITNQNVTFAWSQDSGSEIAVKYKRNNGSEVSLSSGTTSFSDEGTYTIYMTDTAGNYATYTFEIDKTAPTGTLSNVVGQNGYTNKDVTFTWSDSRASAKLNNSSYTKGSTISSEGSYTIVLTDTAGNSTSYSFVIDKTAPTGTLAGIVGEDNYTNRNVTFTWSDNKASAALNGSSYAKEESISDEGNYTVILTDWATNQTVYTFCIDKTAPTGTFSGISGSNNNTNTNASFSWEDPLATAKLNGSDYLKAAIISEEGDYTIILKDKATNETTYELCIDRVAPTGTFSGITNQEYMITNKNVSFSWDDPKASAKLDDQSYSKDTKITNESIYELVLTDYAGNYTTYTFEIDLTKPVVLYNDGEIQDKNYTKKNFKLNLDTSIDTMYVSYLSSYNYEAKELDTTFTDQGYYYVYGKDRAGNESDRYIVYYQTVNDFGNANQIYNQYKKTTWYTVSLPSYIFKATGTLPSIAGTYYFENYDDAFNWAKEQEFTYRVTQSAAGYIYISATSESVSQIYDTRETLDTVIAKYASNYVSSQNIYQNIDVRYSGTIMDGNGTKNSEALTANSISLPTILNTMQSCNLYLCKTTYSFSRLTGLYVDPTVTITYLSNGTTLATAGFSGEIAFGKKIGEFLEQNEAKLQGYYLVEERDLCGNYQSYIIYLDYETPTIIAEAAFGDDTTKTINFTADEVDVHDGTYYFISLELKQIFDNIDSFLCCHIKGSKYNARLTAQDALITLSQETTGEGAYTITCYDRSYNALTFSVYIAGSEPKWNCSGLNSDKLTMRFSTNDDYNAFTALSISIIDYEGNPQTLTEDGDGTAINFTTLRYTFYDGGKYTATVTDLYKRTVTFNPVFFLNGLPQGSFKGVDDGEATNKDVYFYYQKGYQVIVYTLDEERNKTVFSDYTLTYATASLTYTLYIEAANATNGTYLIFLYADGNMASFIEYTFTIDTILADYSLLSINGEDLTSTYSTNEGFYLDWMEDNVTVKYTLDGTAYSRYKQRQKITTDGIYTITITDYVGNSETIVVCVDTAVNYSINGTYTNFAGTLYAKSDVQVIVNEAYTSFLILADNGVTVYDGYITEEGNYVVFIEDNYKNTQRLYIAIDKTAPAGTLNGVENKGTTNGDITFEWDDEDVYKAIRYNKFNTIVGAVTNGEQFTKDGYYKIVLSDKAGNEAKYEFNIDKAVNYSTDIVNKQITTSAVTFAFSEELKTLKVTNNGAEIKEASSYKDLGNYTLYAEDLYGNSINYEFTIINNISRAMDLALYQGQTLSMATLNGEEYQPVYENGLYEFRETGAYQVSIYDSNQKITYSMNFNVDTIAPTIEFEQTSSYAVSLGAFNKKNVTAVLMKDGEEVKFDENSQITDPGSYVLVLTDEYGNETTYEFEVKYHLNTISIILIALGVIVASIIIALIIRSRKVKSA